MAPITEDGAWGPNTLGAVTAMVSVIDPASLSTIIPATDRRSVVISRKIESALSSLQRASAGSSSTSSGGSGSSGGGSSHPILDAGEGYITQQDEGTPVWVYAIAGASFLAAAGVTYAVLNTK
jgi:hypothetical protein